MLNLVKVALVSVGIGGGVTFAIIKMNRAPFWFKVACLMMATASLMIALPELPRGFDAVQETWGKIDELLSHRMAAPTAPAQPSASAPAAPSAPIETPALPPTAAAVTVSPGGLAANASAIDAAIPIPVPADLKPLTPDDVKVSRPADPADISQPIEAGLSLPAPPTTALRPGEHRSLDDYAIKAAIHIAVPGKPPAPDNVEATASLQMVGPPQSLIPQDPGLQIGKHLAAEENARYRLAEGITYLLEAPLGYTVTYRVEEGSMTLSLGGQEVHHCTSGSFTAYPRVLKFTVVACSPRVVLRVVYVRPENYPETVGSSAANRN